MTPPAVVSYPILPYNLDEYSTTVPRRSFVAKDVKETANIKEKKRNLQYDTVH